MTNKIFGVSGIAAVIAVFSMFSVSASARTVGIWTDHRSGISAGLTNSLVKSGWDIEWFSSARGRNDLENPEKLAKTDVMIFLGGWGVYSFPTPQARLELIRYVSAGKGILLSGFRSGYVRTANRPMFPEIGATYNRITSPWIGPEGDSPLARVFDGKIRPLSSTDHLTVKPGPLGTVFCSSGGECVGTFGDFYNGRVVVFGGHFSYQIEDVTREFTEKLFFAALDYLTEKRRARENAEVAVRKAENEFIRREMTYTYTHDDRGPDRRPGQLVVVRDEVLSVAESTALKLEYFISVLESSGVPAKKLGKYKSCAKTTRKMVNAIRFTAKREIERVKEKINEAEIGSVSISSALGKTYIDIERHAKNIRGRLVQKHIDSANALIDELRPQVVAARRAKLEKEIAADLLKIPALIGELSSADESVRFNAALEIGRISPYGDRNAVNALVKCIADPSERVRTQAVTSLGWLQSADAVDALIRHLSGADAFLRRRIIQALGLIGDVKAVPAVMKMLSGGDSLARACAAIALGHLKADVAVDALLDIAENAAEDGDLRLSAVIALGDIGNKRAVERLEKIKESTGKNSRPRNSGGDNYLSSRNALPMAQATSIALGRIAKGGRAVRGVKQPEECRSYDRFYAITKKFNAFAGRTETVSGPFAKMGQKKLWPYVKEAGFTGIHNAWGWRWKYSPEEYTELVREAGELDLIWIDVVPGGNIRSPYAASEVRFAHFEDEGIVAYAGVWAEETWPRLYGSKEEFIAFLQDKYGTDYAARLKLSKAEIAAIEGLSSAGFSCPGPNKPLEAGFAAPWNGALRTLVLEFGAKLLEDHWRESQEFLHSRRKGFAHTYVISCADPTKLIGGMDAVERLDSFGHESYESFGRFTAYFMERYRNGGAARSVMSEQYNWYCPSNEHALRGFWQNAIHSKCYYNFALHQIFEHPSWYESWAWERGRWDCAKQVFQRVRQTPEFYAIKPSAANAAVLFSERASSAVKEQVYFQCTFPTRNDHNTMAAWTALGQSQIHADVLWVESMDEERLAKYRFLYLPSAKYITDAEAELLRKWVAAGGTLVAEGTTSLYGSHSLVNRGNYALADVFGCNWKKTEFRSGDDADTLATRHGSRVSAYPVVPSADDLLHIDDTIHRDRKPEKSIVKASVSASSPSLDGLAAGSKIEIDAALGCDIVEVTSAEVLAKYPSGAPAVLCNKFGKGRCYFITANYFAHAHVVKCWEMMPVRLEFWQNVRELLTAIVRSSYAAMGATLPVEVTGVSPEVAVTVDDHGDRYVVHLLDYDVKSEGVSGALATIPGDRAIKRVYYPGEKEKVLGLEGRSVKLRDFKVYDMIVVEFGK